MDADRLINFDHLGVELEDNPPHPNSVMVDPPEGWRYGFPAILRQNYERQLREAGYPLDRLDMALKHSRYWNLDIA